MAMNSNTTELNQKQQTILDNRKLANFVKNINNEYDNVKHIIAIVNDAEIRKYKNKPNGWKVKLLKVFLIKNDNTKEIIDYNDLWELFEYEPVLYFGNNSNNRVIKPNKFIRINIANHLETFNDKDKEISYYPTTSSIYQSKDEINKLKKYVDKINEMKFELKQQYPWNEPKENTGDIDCGDDISIDLNDL